MWSLVDLCSSHQNYSSIAYGKVPDSSVVRLAVVAVWQRLLTLAIRPIKSSSCHVILTAGFKAYWQDGSRSWCCKSSLKVRFVGQKKMLVKIIRNIDIEHKNYT